MQQGNSLPYLNLSRQVAALERTVQQLVQYQSLLYTEIVGIKRKLGIEEPEMEQHQQMDPRMNGRRQQVSHQQMYSSRGEDLDISSIQKALNLQGQTSSSGRSSRRSAPNSGNNIEAVPAMSSSNIDN